MARSAGRILYAYRPRLDDWRFWMVQALVIGISFTHALLELTGVLGHLELLYFIPISLLVVPVIYAAWVFGFVGSIPTALWVIVISVPNLLLWHHGPERLGELFQMGVLMSVAVFLGLRVDQERRAREQVESTSDAFKASEVKYRSLFESSPVPILLMDKAGAVIDANPPASSLFSKSSAGLAGRKLSDVIGEENARRLLEPPAKGQPPNRAIVTSSKDGALVYLEPSQTRMTDPRGGSLLQVLFRDVTDERYRQAGLKAFAAHMLKVQEDERQSIARELHDETIQSLALMLRRLDAASTGADVPAAVTRELSEARKSGEEVVKGLRDFARSLRPPILDDLGLVPSLRRLLLDFGERTGVNTRLAIDGQQRRLRGETEVGIFRVAQEMLRNVERHSRAKEVTVKMTLGEEDYILDIIDDGVGFNVPENLASLSAAGHLGLLGIQERVELLGGRLEVRSTPGKGTRMTATIPCDGAMGIADY